MPTTCELPDPAIAATCPAAQKPADAAQRVVSRKPAGGLDWGRVLVLTLVVTGHLVGIGLLALPDPDAAPLQSIKRRVADEFDSERLTLFVDLEPAPSPPLPPMPPPERLVVASSMVPAPVASARPTSLAAVATETPTPVPIRAAPPRVVAQPESASAPTPAAPAPVSAPSRSAGDPARVRKDRDIYMRALMAALLQHRSYPPEARKQRARGTVQVRFSLDRDGHVLASSIARGAGYPILEQAALDVLRRADPLPPIPDSLGVARLTVTVPIEYSLITR